MPGERIQAVISWMKRRGKIPGDRDQNGLVKKSPGGHQNIRKGGLIAINLREDMK